MTQLSHNVVNVTNDDEFDDYLEKSNGKPLLVDFYATWCGPCKMIAPQIEELSKQYSDIQFIKVDVDQCQDISQEYKITAMPTFILFKNQKEFTRIRGADINGVRNALNTINATIDNVIQLKQRGNNEYLNNNNYESALQFYKNAIRTLENLDNYMDKYKDIWMSMHSNIALMYLKIGINNDNYNNCIRHCNEVLRKENDPYNEKAFLRKGQAFMKMNNYKYAKQVYGKYMKYDPDNNEMKAKWLEAKQKLKQQNQQNKL